MPEGPPAKRQRTEDDLEPEAEWLTKVNALSRWVRLTFLIYAAFKVNGTIDLRIQLPTSAEFNMDGSIIGLQIDVSSQVHSVLKATTGILPLVLCFIFWTELLPFLQIWHV